MTEWIRYADLTVTPWRNGAGVTREIASQPLEQGFAWRVSIAEISEAGPFSTYPGVDRVLVLIEGQGLELDVAGHRHRLGLHDQLAFAGEAATTGRPVSGPSMDLNVMTTRGEARSDVRVVSVGADGHDLAGSPGIRLVVALSPATARVAGADLALARFDTLICDAPLTLSGPAVVALIDITTAGG